MPFKDVSPMQAKTLAVIYAYACARGRYYMDRWLYPCARLCTQQRDPIDRSIQQLVGSEHYICCHCQQHTMHDAQPHRVCVQFRFLQRARASCFCMRACVGVWNRQPRTTHPSPSDMHACTTLSSYLPQLLTTRKINYKIFWLF